MRKLTFLIIGFAFMGKCNALEPNLFGYFEPQLIGAQLYEDFVMLNSNKLRLDIEAKPAEGVKFGANVNFFNYSGKTAFNLLDYISNDSTSFCTYNTREMYTIQYADNIELDNAYVRLSFNTADLTIGKQQISFGTGYAWNPTDIFNRRDLIDPTYENPGHNATRLDLPLTRIFRVMALYSPGEKWKEPTGLVQLKMKAGHFDLSGTAITTIWFYTSGGYTLIPNYYYSWYHHLSKERRYLYGFDLVGQVLGLGVWAEAAYNVMQREEDFWDSVIGLDYTFRSGFYLLGEVYHNSSGRESSEDYAIIDWTKWLTGESDALGKDQAYLFAQYPLTDLISVGGSLIGCINDESMAIVPQLNYSLFQDVELTAFGNFYLGKEGTMYSKHLGNGGLIRLRVYF